jgi:prevent-host-death family protein
MNPTYVSLTQAKKELEELISGAQRGERIVICRYGKPKAWIEPIHSKRKKAGHI